MAVDRELSYWEKRSPIVLPLLGEELEILLDLLVHPFSLSIRLRVICSSQLPVDAKFLV